MPIKDAEKRKEYCRTYYLNHKDAAHAATKRWYYNNHDYCLSSKSKWRRENPFKAKAVSLISNAQRRAAKKNLECYKSMDWVVAQLEKCRALFGLPFDFNTGVIISPYSLSFDRIDQSKGYTEDNTQVILQGINGLKLTGTNEDVITIAKAICQYIPE